MATTIDSDFGPIDIDAREATGVSGEDAAIFNPAIKGTNRSSGHPLIVLALGGTELLIVDVDGKLSWTDVSAVQVDWRYDFKKEAWVDTSGESLEAAE